jgi:GMP synthase (glutamine-hydrolysing)
MSAVVPSRVLILQHTRAEPPGLVARALEARGLALKTIRTFEGDSVPREMGDAVGLLVMGGPMGVGDADRLAHLREELTLIERSLARGCPVLGICLGSQLLAHVLGAKVTTASRKEIGWHRVTLSQDGLVDPLFKGLESSFVALHWHGDAFDPPVGATLLARSELTECQAFRRGTAYGLLFHMEVTDEIVAAMVKAFAGELESAGLLPAEVLEGARGHLASLSERGRRVFAGLSRRVRVRRRCRRGVARATLRERR